jgi:hypothetical protein
MTSASLFACPCAADEKSSPGQVIDSLRSATVTAASRLNDSRVAAFAVLVVRIVEQPLCA